jgi:ribosome biogenesis protein BRX1
MGFTLADGKVWIRCFQICETESPKTDAASDHSGTAPEAIKGKPKRADTKVSLTEIGPRFVLTPIVILESSFGGPVIYENKEFVSPNQVRSEQRRGKAGKYARRAEGAIESRAKKRDLGLRSGEGRRRRDGDELDAATLFA